MLRNVIQLSAVICYVVGWENTNVEKKFTLTANRRSENNQTSLPATVPTEALPAQQLQDSPPVESRQLPGYKPQEYPEPLANELQGYQQPQNHFAQEYAQQQAFLSQGFQKSEDYPVEGYRQSEDYQVQEYGQPEDDPAQGYDQPQTFPLHGNQQPQDNSQRYDPPEIYPPLGYQQPQDTPAQGLISVNYRTPQSLRMNPPQRPETTYTMPYQSYYSQNPPQYNGQNYPPNLYPPRYNGESFLRTSYAQQFNSHNYPKNTYAQQYNWQNNYQKSIEPFSLRTNGQIQASPENSIANLEKMQKQVRDLMTLPLDKQAKIAPNLKFPANVESLRTNSSLLKQGINNTAKRSAVTTESTAKETTATQTPNPFTQTRQRQVNQPQRYGQPQGYRQPQAYGRPQRYEQPQRYVPPQINPVQRQNYHPQRTDPPQNNPPYQSAPFSYGQKPPYVTRNKNLQAQIQSQPNLSFWCSTIPQSATPQQWDRPATSLKTTSLLQDIPLHKLSGQDIQKMEKDLLEYLTLPDVKPKGPSSSRGGRPEDMQTVRMGTKVAQALIRLAGPEKFVQLVTLRNKVN